MLPCRTLNFIHFIYIYNSSKVFTSCFDKKMKNIGALTDSSLGEKGYMYSYGELRFLLYIQRKILIKKCFIDQKRAKSSSVYSHCTSDPRNPYHNLLAPVTRNCTIFN